ncbi:hypothetical protein YGAWVPHU_CDS0035 [Salmonella phage SeKF_13]
MERFRRLFRRITIAGLYASVNGLEYRLEGN